MPMNYEIYAIRDGFRTLFQRKPTLFEKQLRNLSHLQLLEMTETMDMKLLIEGATRFFEEASIGYDNDQMTWVLNDVGDTKYYLKEIPYGWQLNDYQVNPLFYYLQRHFKETIVIDEFRIVTIVKVKK